MTMAIKIQILSHIHKKCLFHFTTPIHVAFNAKLLALIPQDSVFSRIWLSRRLLSFLTTKAWYFCWRVNVQNSCYFRLNLCFVMLPFFPLYTSLFPKCINLFQQNKVGLICSEIRFFTLVCRDINNHGITFSADHLKQVDSNLMRNFRSSTLVNFNRVTKRMSHCLLGLRS